jgi:hypothetical protein
VTSAAAAAATATAPYRSPADVASLLSQVQYSGLTPLATSLGSKVLQPIVFSLAASGQLAKPVLIITITDGEPTDTPKDLVVQVSTYNGSCRWVGFAHSLVRLGVRVPA